MIKKLLVGLLVIATIAGGVGTYYWFSQAKANEKEKSVLVQQNASLQSAIDAIGPMTTVYTVVDKMECRDTVEEVNLQSMSIPVSATSERTVVTADQIVGKLYKVDVQPGTVLTLDMFMTEEYEEVVYEQDMSFLHLPLGLRVGDYVDIRITYPFGQTFYVIPHKRVEQLVTTTNTIKIYVTAAEQMLFESAMKDYALNSQKGLSVYIVKYVEPGIDADKVSGFYPIRREMEASVLINPNIKTKSKCINSELRDQLDLMLAQVDDIDGAKLGSQVIQSSASLVNAYQLYVESGNTSNIINPSASDYIDLNQTAGQLESDLSQLQEYTGESTVNPNATHKTDAQGNMTSVTDSERTQAGGQPIFQEEETIE